MLATKRNMTQVAFQTAFFEAVKDGSLNGGKKKKQSSEIAE